MTGLTSVLAEREKFVDNQQGLKVFKYNALSGNTASGHSRPSI
jgi:hypothetical protein